MMTFKRYRLSARSRLASWFNGTKFDPSKLRGVLVGIVSSITLGEVCCYRLIKQDIKAGELPFYTADLMIVVFAIFEAVAAPLVSWWGFRKRRMLLTWYAVAAFVCFISWFLLPEKLERQESELCNAANHTNYIGFSGTSPRTVIRLVIVSISCIIFILTRVVCWSHGIAYSDEYAPARTSMHYGFLLLARIIPFFLGHKILTDMMESNIILHIVFLLFGFTSNFVRLPCVIPKEAPVVDGVQMTALSLEDRGLCKSIGRVLHNRVAMTLIFSTGLTTASVWGYGYYELDITKVKFSLLPNTNKYEFLAEIWMCHFIIVAVAYAGVVFSAPVLMEFCKLKALKQAVAMSIPMFLIYITTTMTALTNCEKGNIAGLVNGDYGHPECSLSCNCEPQWDEYKPVCAVDNMITYLSPCHAGCSESQEINGIQVYSNCTCVGGGRVLEHACSGASCQSAYLLYSLLYHILITLAILVFQAQGVLLLRVVDQRDKSVAMGVACSIVVMMTFVVGQLLFYGIQVFTCRWFVDGRCHLQSEAFAHVLGATCAFLMFTSIVTTITSWKFFRITNKNKTNILVTRL